VALVHPGRRTGCHCALPAAVLAVLAKGEGALRARQTGLNSRNSALTQPIQTIKLALAMMSFDTFFANLISTAELIASPNALPRTWIRGNDSVTSAFDYDELAVQLLDDLDLKGQIPRFSRELREIGAFDALTDFLSALIAVDSGIPSQPQRCGRTPTCGRREPG